MYEVSTTDVVYSIPSDRPSFLRKQVVVWPSLLVGILATLLLIATIILAILYGIERGKTKVQLQTPVNDSNDMCLTPYCIKAANYLLESIDETIDPCENFYEFACGTWIKNARLPDDMDVQISFTAAQTQLNDAMIDLLSLLSPNGTKELTAIVNTRRLYDSCVKEDAIEAEGVSTILSFIDTELGGWPILHNITWENSTLNFSQLLIKLNSYNSPIFYHAFTQVNDKNSSIQGIRIGQSGLGLKNRKYYTKESVFTIAYKNYMRDLAQALSHETLINDTDVNDIFEFEKAIAKYHWLPKEQHSRSTETVYTTLGNLMNTVNITFNLTDYLRQLYLVANVTLTDSDVVTVSEVEFLRNVSSIIDRQSARTLKNYMIWRFMMSQVKYMPKKYSVIKQKFDQVFEGISTESSRTILCVSYVNDVMGLVVSKLYIDKYFDKNARTQSLEMISNIRAAFIDMINQSTWMDIQSKNKAIEKARAIKEGIGYPEYLDNNITKLEVDFAEYNFSSSFIQNSLLILKLISKRNRQALRKPFDRTPWTDSASTVVNAFYNPSFNDIAFPAGILQPPFFHKDAPKYLNYGAIGTIMGHEMTHGFDDIGRQYDIDGDIITWWTNETINAFNERKTCFIDQYSNYTVIQIDEKVDGQQTQGENIADIGGLKEAFLAYQKWSQTSQNIDKKLPGLAKYSAEQMFFMSFGHMWCVKMTDQLAKILVLLDTHSLPQFRVLGSTSNFAEFDRVFGCKRGQGNSQVTKCSMW